jgi:hypothetical protein
MFANKSLTRATIGIIFPNMSENVNQAISAAVLRLLRPLVRILLRNGMPYGAFADLAKRVFVDAAISEHRIPGRKPSISSTSIITGLSRKEVQRVMGLSLPDDAGAFAQYNRAARVLSGWVRNSAYVDREGNPLSLPFDGPEPSFATLVKLFSGDVPPRAILDELVRVGAVTRDPDGHIRLVTRAYVPRTGETEKLSILGTDVRELIATIDHNLTCAPGDAHLQRKVSYDNLPVETLPTLRLLAAEHGQALLEQLDRWMSEHDRDTAPSVTGTGRARASIGIYYFKETNSEEEDA